MLMERILRPGYIVKVIKMRKRGQEGIIEGFKRRGFHVWKPTEGFDMELGVESFIASTYGRYVYVLRFNEGTYLARGERRITERGLGNLDSYFVGDENGLKRFLLRELSLKSKLLLELPSMAIWTAISLGILSRIRENPIGSFLLIVFGFLLDDVSRVLEYLILGYCKA